MIADGFEFIDYKNKNLIKGYIFKKIRIAQ